MQLKIQAASEFQAVQVCTFKGKIYTVIHIAIMSRGEERERPDKREREKTPSNRQEKFSTKS